ncbi:hypothetical protein JCM14469_04380 [Desulfatiferula olefinivorans]
MPKELTHLIIADITGERFSDHHPRGLLSDCIHRFKDAYRFGAVMHDIAFCGSSSDRGRQLKDRGLSIHGASTDDILGPFRYLAAAVDATGDLRCLAMTAGALTHMAADAVFHPMVYYYSGHDLSRHYRLETLIDTHLFRHQALRLKCFSDPSALYDTLRDNVDGLAVHLAGFLGLPESFLPEIVRALKLHAFTLRLFRSRIGYLVFRLIAAVGSETFRNKAHLFYPPGMRFTAPFFEGIIRYRHPVTGEYLKGSLDDFVDTSVHRALDMFTALQAAAEKRHLLSFVSGLPALSLETGLAPSAGRTFRYSDLRSPIDGLASQRPPCRGPEVMS